MKLVGNTADIIDWDDVYKTINASKTDNWVRNLTYDMELPDNISETYKRDQYRIFYPLMKVGYHEMNHIRWRVFQPGIDFDMAINDQLAEYVGCEPFYSWISCMEPGCMVPMHMDTYRIDKMKQYYENKDRVVRCTAHITDPSFGHVFCCEGTYCHDEAKGNVYMWDNPDALHGGCNFGIHKKYLYNFLGFRL